MNTLAKFVFIYEKKIKYRSRVDEFAEVSTEASYAFKHNIQPHVKFATKKEIVNQTDFSKQTLFFTGDSKAAQIYNFCRHLRNSFNHAQLQKNAKELFILDNDNHRRPTCRGWLEYAMVKDFLVWIIRDYESKENTIH